MVSIKIKSIYLLLLWICISIGTYAQNSQAKQDSARIERFYKSINKPYFWFSTPKNIQKANEWLKVMESREVRNLGFFVNNTEMDNWHSILKNSKNLDNSIKDQTDKQISSLVLKFIKFLHEGDAPFQYNAYNVNRDSIYIGQLIDSQKRASVEITVANLDCKGSDYLTLKRYLNDSVSDKTSVLAKKIWLSMNYQRYLTANESDEKIIVNIPEARAVYYRDKLPTVKMLVVPGKKDDPTPVMASYITSIITFPPWRVPQSIAVDEILPKVQQDIKYLEDNNFVVVDAKEKEVDIAELKWEEYNKDNFPYFFRQLPGPDNSLGVIKFNLKNPMNIYLHATSWQGAFKQESRFLSHGCVRLEKPYDLANAILRGQIDREELAKVRDSIQTREYSIKRKIPTYLVYIPAVVNGSKVTILNDIYGLIE